MDVNESSAYLSVSQELTPPSSSSPTVTSDTVQQRHELENVVEENETGVLRSRGRGRRRPGRARVRLQENPVDSDGVPTGKRDESSDLLHPQSLTFAEFPDSTSPTPSKLGSARGSFRNLVTKVSQKIQPTKKQDHPLKRRATRRARAGSVRYRSGSRKLNRCASVRSNRSMVSDPGTCRANPNGKPGGVLPLGTGDAEAGRGHLLSRENSQRENDEISPNKTSVKESLINMVLKSWSNFQLLIGVRKDEPVVTQDIVKEPILEDLDLPHRYRPENLEMLCEATGFKRAEMKRIYRGFKTECPTGLITEEVFHGIYSRFFPHGAAFNWTDSDGIVRSSVQSNQKMTKKMKKEAQSNQANLSSYSHYVFSTLDHEDTGVITFEDFVIGLSILLRGSLDDKLRWTFSLYDQDRDGFISREEMEDVVGSVFDLMGRTSDPILEEEVISERVDTIFEKLDLNGDGMVSLEEFLEACKSDETIYQSVDSFTNSVI